MKQIKRWGRPIAALMALTLVVSPSFAVEYGNLVNVDGSYSISSGQSTSGFLLGAGSSAGNYMIQIGADASDDYAGGILIPSISENLRDGLSYTASVLPNASGQYAINVNSTVPLGEMSGDSNVAAAYFGFSEGWISGYSYNSDGSTTGTMDSFTGTNGATFYDNGTGVTQLWLPGVSRGDGVLIATSLGGSENLAMVDYNSDGSFSIMNHSNKVDGTSFTAAAVGYAFIPYNTPNVAAGEFTGNGGVISGTDNFTVRSTADGVFELTIDGYDPTQGTLLVTPAGASHGTGVDNMITYQVVGDHFEINLRDLNGADTIPSLQDCGSLPSVNFAFLPFNTQITAPSTLPTGRDASLVSAGNVVVTEYTPDNDAGDMYAEYAQSTGNLSVADMNRGDHGLSVNGQLAQFSTGIPFVTVSEHFRDNYATGGRIGNSLITVYPTSSGNADSTGWEIATHVADDADAGEFNINYGISFFPYEAGFAMRSSEPTNFLTGTDSLQVDDTSVDTRSDGLLFVNSVGNEANYAAAAAKSDGSGWDVTVFDSGGVAKAGSAEAYNYIYLPFGENATQNVAMASVDATGTVQQSQGGITVTQDTSSGMAGVYRVTIDGKTPEDGMLMLTATNGGTAAGNAFLVYEAEKDAYGELTGAFLVHGYQGVDVDPAAPMPGEAQAMDTGFSVAFVDFENAPELGSEAVNPFDTPQVALGSWEVTAQDGDNTAPIINRLGTSDTQFDLASEVSSRGDLRVAWDNGPLYSTRGLLFTQVCENQRDNSNVITNTTTDPITFSYNGHGLSTANSTGNGYEIATSVINSGNGEFDCNVAAAFIPYEAGFQMGMQAIPGAKYQLRLEGTGDVRQSGVLITTAINNDDNFSGSWANDDGTGWDVQVRDNGSGMEGDDFEYIYLPYGTNNLTAGVVHSDGGLYNGTGDFILERLSDCDTTGDGSADNGVYRLTIKNESPETGILLLTGSDTDNALTYAPEVDSAGNPTGSFLIQGLDTGSGAATPQDTYFSFAFSSYANPISNPSQRELLDPSVCSATNIATTQLATDNAAANTVTVTPQDSVTFERQATERTFVRSSNRGDYNITIDGIDPTAQTGILMATVRNNGRDHNDGDGTTWAIAGAAFNPDSTGSASWISLGRMGGAGATSGSSEANADVAAAYFDFSGNWAGAFIDGDDGSVVSSGLGNYSVTRNDVGSYTLTIDGVKASDKGLLFAIAGSNGDEVVSVASKGSGVWDLGVIDGTAGDLSAFEGEQGLTDAQFSFLYLPMGEFEGYEIENLLAAQIAADGSTVMSEGNFTLTHEATGTYRLSIDGVTPDDAMLLLTGADSSIDDNVFSYEADGSDFLIKSNDLGNGELGLLQDAGFNFALIDFDNPMSVIESTTVHIAGDANGDGKVDGSDVTILAGNWQHGVTGEANATWEMGDFNGDGKVDGSDVTILAGNWQYGVDSAATAVPEPATMTLLALLASLALVSYRRKR